MLDTVKKFIQISKKNENMFEIKIYCETYFLFIFYRNTKKPKRKKADLSNTDLKFLKCENEPFNLSATFYIQNEDLYYKDDNQNFILLVKEMNLSFDDLYDAISKILSEHPNVNPQRLKDSLEFQNPLFDREDDDEEKNFSSLKRNDTDVSYKIAAADNAVAVMKSLKNVKKSPAAMPFVFDF